MDYNPANIVPKGWKQGDYYPTTLGPYDTWAIEYGYKPFSGGTTGEQSDLKKIASKSGEAALAFATDEDTRDACRCEGAARRADDAGRKHLQRQEFSVPAGAAQPARLVALEPLGRPRNGSQGFRRSRFRLAVARPDS